MAQTVDCPQCVLCCVVCALANCLPICVQYIRYLIAYIITRIGRRRTLHVCVHAFCSPRTLFRVCVCVCACAFICVARATSSLPLLLPFGPDHKTRSRYGLFAKNIQIVRAFPWRPTRTRRRSQQQQQQHQCPAAIANTHMHKRILVWSVLLPHTKPGGSIKRLQCRRI